LKPASHQALRFCGGRSQANLLPVFVIQPLQSLSRIVLLLASVSGACMNPATAQLRIVSYNTSTGEAVGGVQTARDGAATVLEAIGRQTVNGIARPIDVLILQEQASMAVSTQSFVDLLDGIYGPGTYARSEIDGFASDPDRRGGVPGLVYNTDSVSLIDESRFGAVRGSAQPRSSMYYRLRPVGYGESADIHIFNDHYKSDTGSENINRRLLEAESVRVRGDALGEGANIVYVGDFNIQNSSEPMYQTLLAAGAGQAFDPLDAPGVWHNSFALRQTHTQAPAATGDPNRPAGLAGGGVDDRFDFQLVSGELLDTEGMDYIGGSYCAFGNNGTHLCCNSSITTGNGASDSVLDALVTASDHLPVVVDYQLPAVLGVHVAVIPNLVELGVEAAIEVVITNEAKALTANGADELDFVLSVAGDLVGGMAGAILPLSDGVLATVLLDTSTPGTKSGEITVVSDSPGAANPLVTIPFDYTVGDGFAAADFDLNGAVDGDDLELWQHGFGLTNNAAKSDGDADDDGAVDGSDMLVWQRQFGLSAAVEGRLPSAAPEPSALTLACASLSTAMIGFAAALRGRTTNA